MCARFFFPDTDSLAWRETFLRLMQEIAPDARIPDSLSAGEKGPGSTCLVLAPGRASRRVRAFPMTWGLDTGKALVINARSESAGTRPLFRESLAHRRCLIPMMHYFEWKHAQKPHQKYAIRPKAGGMACLAGLYRLEGASARFTVLTRPASDSVSALHDRMPVILPLACAGAWLDTAQTDAAGLMARLSLTDMCLTPVGGNVSLFDLPSAEEW